MISFPLFETWCEFKSEFKETLITNGLEPNRRLLLSKIDETKSMTEQTTEKKEAVSPSKVAQEPATPSKDFGNRAEENDQPVKD